MFSASMLQDVVSTSENGKNNQTYCKLGCAGGAEGGGGGMGGGTDMTSNLLNNRVTGLAALPFTSYWSYHS